MISRINVIYSGSCRFRALLAVTGWFRVREQEAEAGVQDSYGALRLGHEACIAHVVIYQPLAHNDQEHDGDIPQGRGVVLSLGTHAHEDNV